MSYYSCSSGLWRKCTELVVAPGLPLGDAELLALFIFIAAFRLFNLSVKREIILIKLALDYP